MTHLLVQVIDLLLRIASELESLLHFIDRRQSNFRTSAEATTRAHERTTKTARATGPAARPLFWLRLNALRQNDQGQQGNRPMPRCTPSSSHFLPFKTLS